MSIVGNYTALITPFFKNQEIDYGSLRKLIKFQVQNSDGIVALGSTAEATMLDNYEKHKIMEHITSLTEKKIKIIAGINAFSLQDAIHQSHQRFIDGADALLISPPPYIKPSKNGLIAFYKTLADQSYIPIILYNIPSRTGIHIPLDIIKELSLHENIIGIKEASGDISLGVSISSLVNEQFSLLAGNDNIYIPLLSLGATGIISVIGNILPNICKQTTDLYLSNRQTEAKKLYHSYINIINSLSLESNPICIKYILSELNIIKPYFRKPLCMPTLKNRKQLKLEIENIKNKLELPLKYLT